MAMKKIAVKILANTGYFSHENLLDVIVYKRIHEL
jgi:hypothetical protein